MFRWICLGAFHDLMGWACDVEVNREGVCGVRSEARKWIGMHHPMIEERWCCRDQ